MRRIRVSAASAAWEPGSRSPSESYTPGCRPIEQHRSRLRIRCVCVAVDVAARFRRDEPLFVPPPLLVSARHRRHSDVRPPALEGSRPCGSVLAVAGVSGARARRAYNVCGARGPEALLSAVPLRWASVGRRFCSPSRCSFRGRVCGPTRRSQRRRRSSFRIRLWR